MIIPKNLLHYVISYSILLMLVSLTAVFPLKAESVWRRLHLGETYLQEATFFAEDTLTFTRSGEPWRWSGWLFDVGLALAFDQPTAETFALLRALIVIGLFMGPVAWLYYRRFPPWIAFFFTALTWLVSRSTFRFSPLLLGHLLAVMLILTPAEYWAARGRKRMLILAGWFFAFMLWSNLGATPTLGWFIIVSFTIGRAAEAYFSRRTALHSNHLEVLANGLLLLAAAVAGSLLHLAGPMAAFAALQRYVAELDPEVVALDQMTLSQWPEVWLFAFLVLAAWAIVFLIPATFSPHGTSMLLLGTMFSIGSRNFILECSLMILPAAASVISEHLPERRRDEPHLERILASIQQLLANNLPVRMAAIAIMVSGVLGLAWLSFDTPHYPFRFQPNRYTLPAHAVERLTTWHAEAHPIGDRVYAYPAQGPFISYASRGELKVWMDDRSELFQGITRSFPRNLEFFATQLDRYEVNVAILPVRLPTGQLSYTMNSHLRQPYSGFRIVYFDDRFEIYLRETNELKPLLERHGYWFIHPEYDVPVTSRQELQRALLEARRATTEAPESSRAWRERLRVATELEDAEEVIACYRKLWHLNKDESPQIGYLLAQKLRTAGLVDEAREVLELCVRIFPRYAEAHLELGILYTVDDDEPTKGRALMNRAYELKPELLE